MPADLHQTSDPPVSRSIVAKFAGHSGDDERLVFGLASVSQTADGQTLTDLQGDRIDPQTLESAFYDFVENSGLGDVNHDGRDVSVCVECFVVTPQKLDLLYKALGANSAIPDFRGVAAWVAFRVRSDEVWKRVKSGELRGFSIEGTAERVEVSA